MDHKLIRFFVSRTAPRDSDRLVIRARDRQLLETMLERVQLSGVGVVTGDPDGPDYQVTDIVTGEGTDVAVVRG